MICPQHDTHIDNCVHRDHEDVHWYELRIPMHCTTREILLLAMDAQMLVRNMGKTNVPVNIAVQSEYDFDFATRIINGEV